MTCPVLSIAMGLCAYCCTGLCCPCGTDLCSAPTNGAKILPTDLGCGGTSGRNFSRAPRYPPPSYSYSRLGTS
eukprot:1431195-Rhodomonas_salina.1